MYDDNVADKEFTPMDGCGASTIYLCNISHFASMQKKQQLQD